MFGYQPNLLSHQLGLSQSFPKSYFSRKSELCLSTGEMTEAEYNESLNRQANVCIDLTPFQFQPSSYCTQEFDTWWKVYHTNQFVVVSNLMHSLTEAFSSM